MLRVTQQSSPAKAKEYYSVADYYTEGQELIGEWDGRGAVMLGLHGVVGQPEFVALCDNLHPTTGRPLTARTNQDRTVGYDFTWSVPKSMSVLYAMTQDQGLLDAFRVRLANRLRDQGYDLALTRDDFEIAGIPQAAVEKFSRRTAKIEKEAEKLGITDPDRKAELGAKTREKKGQTLSWGELRSHWDTRLSDAEREALAHVHARETRLQSPERIASRAVEHAFLHCFENRSVVSEKELLAEGLRYGLGACTIPELHAEFARHKPIVREIDGRRMVTTREILAEEKEIVRFVRNGRGKCRSLTGFDRDLSKAELSKEQKQAVKHLWRSPDRVMLIRGAAGVGKTRLLKEAVLGIAANGTEVVTLAPTADASRDVLRREGFEEADTVARFLVDEEYRERARGGGVVLVDEASLLGTRTLTRLLRHAEQLDARVILVGDIRQYRSVERGDLQGCSPPSAARARNGLH